MSRIENLAGCRNVLAGAFASAVMIAMSTSGAMAIVGCAGTNGTSGFTSNPSLLNLQCMQPIFLPTTLQPLQSFGESLLVRTSGTAANYYLADRSNLGVIVVNASNMTYKGLLKPTQTHLNSLSNTKPICSAGAGGLATTTCGAGSVPQGVLGPNDPTGGFFGQLIYTQGYANVDTTRPGTVAESNSGPNGMAVYNNRWLYVADGGCQQNANAGGFTGTTQGGGADRACGLPADPSVAGNVVNGVSQQNPLFTSADCVNPVPSVLPPNTVCFAQEHQPSVKLFDLSTNTYVASFPTGGGCVNSNNIGLPTLGTQQAFLAPPSNPQAPGFVHPCTAPLGNYAPGTSLQGMFGKTSAQDIAIGQDSHDGKVYVLVSTPDENYFEGTGCTQVSISTGIPYPSGMPPTPADQNGCVGNNPIGPFTGVSGSCQNNFPTPTPWDDIVIFKTATTVPPYGVSPTGPFVAGQTSYGYLTLFTMNPENGYLTYQATIKNSDNQAVGTHTGTNQTNAAPGGPFPAQAWYPDVRLQIVASGFISCDAKGRRPAQSFGRTSAIAWNPNAGVGGAFFVAIPAIMNNPAICYNPTANNLCNYPTTTPPGPGATSQTFQGQSYLPGPFFPPASTNDGAPAGGCVWTGATPPPPNLVTNINNPAAGGWIWNCDGGVAMIDPVYVYNGRHQPNILTQYPEYNIPVGQVYDNIAGCDFTVTPGTCPPLAAPPAGGCGTSGSPVLPQHCSYFNTVGSELTTVPGTVPGVASGTTPTGQPDQCYFTYTAPSTTAGGCRGIISVTTGGSIGGVVILPYCSPGVAAIGPNDIPGQPGDVGALTKTTSTFNNMFFGCNPIYNGNVAGVGQGQNTPSIAETYSLALNTISATSQNALFPAGQPHTPCTAGFLGVGCGSVSITPLQNCLVSSVPVQGCGQFNDFFMPGPYPAKNPLPLFAFVNGNTNTPQPIGCNSQSPAIPTGQSAGTCGGNATAPSYGGITNPNTDSASPFTPPNAVSQFCQNGALGGSSLCSKVTGTQVMAGQLTGSQKFNNVTLNGVTAAHLNVSNIARDPHWWVAVGGRLWLTAQAMNPTPNPGGVASKVPAIGYIDALSNVVVEYTPTSSGSNTIAVDEQNYVAFLPVNGVQYSGLPAGDFTGNGAKLCGNSTTINDLTTGPGCIIVFRQQYLSPLGSNRAAGN